SIAVSVLDSGHPVRLLGGGINPDAGTGDRGHQTALARAAILNQTVDLKPAVSPNAAELHIVEAGRGSSETAPSGEVTVAILEPLGKPALDVLVPIGDHGRAWAIVR